MGRQQCVIIIASVLAALARVEQMPVWWDRRRFFERFGERRIDTGHPIYVDDGLLLTQGEGQAWDRACRERFVEDERRRRAAIRDAMRVWEQKLRGARWVIVESYEWESGPA